MKHYIRQKTDNSIQYTRHLIHKPRSIVLSKGHLTRNTFKSNIFMLINKLIVKFYVHGSLGVLQSWYLAYWWVSNCFFHELSYVKSLDFGPTFFVVIFNVICLTINNLSGILDTTDTSFVHPWALITSNSSFYSLPLCLNWFCNFKLFVSKCPNYGKGRGGGRGPQNWYPWYPGYQTNCWW